MGLRRKSYDALHPHSTHAPACRSPPLHNHVPPPRNAQGLALLRSLLNELSAAKPPPRKVIIPPSESIRIARPFHSEFWHRTALGYTFRVLSSAGHVPPPLGLSTLSRECASLATRRPLPFESCRLDHISHCRFSPLTQWALLAKRAK